MKQILFAAAFLVCLLDQQFALCGNLNVKADWSGVPSKGQMFLRDRCKFLLGGSGMGVRMESFPQRSTLLSFHQIGDDDSVLDLRWTCPRDERCADLKYGYFPFRLRETAKHFSKSAVGFVAKDCGSIHVDYRDKITKAIESGDYAAADVLYYNAVEYYGILDTARGGEWHNALLSEMVDTAINRGLRSRAESEVEIIRGWILARIELAASSERGSLGRALRDWSLFSKRAYASSKIRDWPNEGLYSDNAGKMFRGQVYYNWMKDDVDRISRRVFKQKIFAEEISRVLPAQQQYLLVEPEDVSLAPYAEALTELAGHWNRTRWDMPDESQRSPCGR